MTTLSDLSTVSRGTKIFTRLSGSGVWTRPSNLIGDTILVTMIGGGGGGAGVSATTYAAGGCGGSAIQQIPYQPASSVAYSCGAGGAGALSNGANGTDGGATSFGSIIVPGGSGANPTTTAPPVGTVGSFPVLVGSGAGYPAPAQEYGAPYGAIGGGIPAAETKYGGGGGGLVLTGVAVQAPGSAEADTGMPGQGYGAGGYNADISGAATAAGDGADGQILLEYWVN